MGAPPVVTRRWTLLSLSGLLALAACTSWPTQRPLRTTASLVQPMATAPEAQIQRALIVFVRFRDDTLSWAEACSPAGQQWAAPDRLPRLASTVLASSPQRPFPPTSLTAYFHQQSLGRFVLVGDVAPQVIVSEAPEATYDIRTPASLDGLARLTEEIVDALDPSTDFSDYDADGDGVVDKLIVVLRRTQLTVSWSGYATLGRFRTPLVRDGVRIDGPRTGSYVRYDMAGNIYPDLNLTRLLAHELGHHLWASTPTRGHHLTPLGGPLAQGAPASDPSRLGYALMVGGSTYDARGDLTISAFERDLLGWIDCPTLRRDTTVTLGDLYATGACAQLATTSAGGRQRQLYLTNRQRVGPFDRLRTNTCTTPPNEQGLKTTGLLAMLAEEHRRVAVLAADGTLDLSIAAAPYQGDLFGPSTQTQLSPWTRPNSNGYTTYPPGFAMRPEHWQALEQIGAAHEAVPLRFTYRADARVRPSFYTDAWIGPETNGDTLVGPLTIHDGATLTLAPGLALALAGTPTVTVRGTLALTDPALSTLTEDPLSIVVEVGGQLIVGDSLQPGGRFQLPAGATLDLGAAGRLVLHGSRLIVPPGATLRYDTLAQVVRRGTSARVVRF